MYQEFMFFVLFVYIVVACSFRTPDEDFGILLEAAVMYDRRVSAALKEDDSINDEKLWTDVISGSQCIYPRLLFIITGIFFLYYLFR
jgi:beta-1,4-mannosyltransferase